MEILDQPVAPHLDSILTFSRTTLVLGMTADSLGALLSDSQSAGQAWELEIEECFALSHL